MSNSVFTYNVWDVLTENDYSLTGWTFQGWATSPTGDVTYVDASKVVNLTANNGEELELFAVWLPNTYTIAYDANGGTGTMGASTHTYDESSQLHTNAFQRTGHAFLGWSEESDAAIASYADGSNIKNVTEGSSIKLYAVWAKTSYSGSWAMEKKLGRDSSYSQTISPEFDIEALLKAGYSTVTLILKVKHEETNLICHNKCRVQIYSKDGSKKIVDTTWDPKASEKTEIISVTISLHDLGTDGAIVVTYSTKDDGGSSSDGWYMRDPNITMVVS